MNKDIVRVTSGNSNIENFLDDLNKIHWDPITSMNNLHDAYDSFLDSILTLYDKHFPLNEVKRRYNICKSPWLSDGIYNSIRKKNHLYRKFLRNPTSQNKSIYILYKTKLNTLIRAMLKEPGI